MCLACAPVAGGIAWQLLQAAGVGVTGARAEAMAWSWAAESVER